MVYFVEPLRIQRETLVNGTEGSDIRIRSHHVDTTMGVKAGRRADIHSRVRSIKHSEPTMPWISQDTGQNVT